jgi:hypothetical protein
MCRSIKRLRDGAEAAPPDEVRAAALQFVRKVSGFSRPAAHNQAAFEAAVDDVALATSRLLRSLDVRGAAPAAGAARGEPAAAARR